MVVVVAVYSLLGPGNLRMWVKENYLLVDGKVTPLNTQVYFKGLLNVH